MYLTHKDHKKDPGKTRPIGTANCSNTRGCVSDLLEALANSEEASYEVISSEDLISSTKEHNERVEEMKTEVISGRKRKLECTHCKLWRIGCKKRGEQDEVVHVEEDEVVHEVVLLPNMPSPSSSSNPSDQDVKTLETVLPPPQFSHPPDQAVKSLETVLPPPSVSHPPDQAVKNLETVLPPPISISQNLVPGDPK